MSRKKTVKTLKVLDVHRLCPGTQFEMASFQVAASAPDGTISMVNAEILETVPRSDLVGYEIRPGVWRVTPEDGMQPLALQPEAYYETDTSRMMLRHLNAFLNKTSVYKKYNMPPRRGILLGGEPGTGKSALLRHFCRSLREREKTCILRLDSSSIPYEQLTHMMLNSDTEKVEFLCLIIEDLGGTSLNERGSNVSTTMLNFLDGNKDVYRMPTLIVATTNYLDELQDTLTSRPGRFDVVEVVSPPAWSEVCFLVESCTQRSLTASERSALENTNFTPAYCIEAVIRSELYDISLEESIQQLLEQRKRSISKTHMTKSNSMGFANDEDY